MKQTKASPRIVVRQGSPTGKRITAISGKNADDPLKLAQRLTTLLTTEANKSGSRLLFITFPAAPAGQFRAALVNHLDELLVGAEEDLERADNEDYWGSPRIGAPARSEPSFAVVFEGHPAWYCGFWTDPTTLVLGDLDTYSPLEGICSAAASHWCPNSMTSGCWRDEYVILGNGLDVEWSFKDDDGTYIAFHRGRDNSPRAVSKRLEKGISRWYLYGAENYLLTAHFMGFSGGTLNLFPQADDASYEIETFSLHAEKNIMRELRKRHPTPSREEADKWLQEVRSIADEYPGLWERYTTGEYAYEFLLTLIAVAEGTA